MKSGVHRGQRVPETEKSRPNSHFNMHSCSFAEVKKKLIEILDKDLKIDTYRSSGAGGQHVNKTESAIKNNTFANQYCCCLSRWSVLKWKNKEKAMKVLKGQNYMTYYKEERRQKYKQNRKSQVGNWG